MAKPQSGNLGSVIRALFACQVCVGNHVLLNWRLLNLAAGRGDSLTVSLRIFGRGLRPTTPVVAGADFSGASAIDTSPAVLSTPLLFSACFFLAFRFARIPRRFAVSILILALVVLGFRRRGSTIGVLSSAISFFARALSLRGTRFGLWLAVRRLSPRGTC